LQYERRLPELSPLLHPHRIASFVFLTFLLPEAWRGGPDKVNWSYRLELREGIKLMLQETFGNGFVIGFRFGAHQGRSRGFHIHVILSLLRFSRGIEQDAKSFVALSEESKAKALPYLFEGPHIDPDTIQPLLVRPYGELLGKILGTFDDNANDLVHIRETWNDRQTSKDRWSANTYLSRRWKVFDKVRLRGYYREERGSEVLLEQNDSNHQVFRTSLNEFVQDYLLNKCKDRFRRGSFGFHHGRNKFAAVVDFAARQPHPREDNRCFLDQNPRELASLAAQLTAEMSSVSIIDVRNDNGGAKTMKIKSKGHFPVDRLPDMLTSWPFILVDFNLPKGILRSATLPVIYEKACKGVVEIIRATFERGTAKIGYLIVPASTGNGRDEGMAVRVHLSQIKFDDGDSELIQDFLCLPEAEQAEFLSALYRHPAFLPEGNVPESLRTGWFEWTKRVVPGKACPGVRVRRAEPASLQESIRTAGPLVEPKVRELVLAATLEGDGKSYRYRLPDGTSSGWFKSLETLGRNLDGRISLVRPRAFGFFHNKSHAFSLVAKLGIGKNFDELRAQGETALFQLCERLEIDPTTFAKTKKSITDHLGNAASNRSGNDEEAA
jgi:hypothetical protein